MKTILLITTLLLAFVNMNATDPPPPNIGDITVNWTTNTNCNPLETGDQWEVSFVILNYPSLTTFWPIASITHTDKPTGEVAFNVATTCTDSQAQYLVIAVVRLIRSGNEIGRGEYRSVMGCHNLYQLPSTGIDVEVICD